MDPTETLPWDPRLKLKHSIETVIESEVNRVVRHGGLRRVFHSRRIEHWRPEARLQNRTRHIGGGLWVRLAARKREGRDNNGSRTSGPCGTACMDGNPSRCQLRRVLAARVQVSGSC